MAAILVDGFDLYNGIVTNTGVQAKWTLSATTTSIAMVSGRFTGQAISIPAFNAVRTAARSFTANASVSVGFAHNASVLPGANVIAPIVSLLSSSTFMVGLVITTTGALQAYRLTSISAGTQLGSNSVNCIAANTWHYIELEVTVSDTVGVFNVYVDGVQVLNLTSQDTRNGVPTTVDTVQFGSGGTNGTTNGFTQLVDDLYVTNTATKLGERRVETLYPTSDVTQVWGRSTGATNYTLVDEAQVNGDTDYVQTSAVNDRDTYGFGNLTGSPTTIDAVQVTAFAEKTDATARSIALQVISGVTTSDGANFALAASYGRFERLMTVDPNGSITWTATNVNALTGGPKVTV
jgi:hypothetical protein